MNYSAGLKAKIDELGLKKENILYLPIAKQHLNRIKNKTKVIEFRDHTDYYLKKLGKYDKTGEWVEDKPLTHILFQGGYNTDSPRMLMSFSDHLLKYEEVMNPEAPKTKLLLEEAAKEGFEGDDTYIGFFLEKIEFEENF